jgi:hypothetical protein
LLSEHRDVERAGVEQRALLDADVRADRARTVTDTRREVAALRGWSA